MNNSSYRKDIIKKLNQLAYTKRLDKIFSDMVEMAAIAIQNSCLCSQKNAELQKLYKEREERYLSLINSYNESEREVFPEILALIVLELERNQEQDLLGSLYMELELDNKNSGQFFTPYNISKLMSEITVDKKGLTKLIKNKGFCSLSDPACGAGCTLIASINTCKNHFKRLNYQNHIYIVGQDIEKLVALMCYVQISFLGVAGYIKVGDTLSNPLCTEDINKLHSIWFTPIWFNDVWSNRRLFHGKNILML